MPDHPLTCAHCGLPVRIFEDEHRRSTYIHLANPDLEFFGCAPATGDKTRADCWAAPEGTAVLTHLQEMANDLT